MQYAPAIRGRPQQDEQLTDPLTTGPPSLGLMQPKFDTTHNSTTYSDIDVARAAAAQ